MALCVIPFFKNKVGNAVSIKKLYLKDGFLFEELGIKYYGPINGHDYKEMLSYLELAKKYPERIIVIDASGTKEQTHEKIVSALKARGVL